MTDDEIQAQAKRVMAEKIQAIIIEQQQKIDHARRVYIKQHNLAEQNLAKHRDTFLALLKWSGIPATAEIKLSSEGRSSAESYHGSTFFTVYTLKGYIDLDIAGLKPVRLNVSSGQYLLNSETGKWEFREPGWSVYCNYCQYAKVAEVDELRKVLLSEIEYQAAYQKFSRYEGENFKRWSLGKGYKEAVNKLLETTDVYDIPVPPDLDEDD